MTKSRGILKEPRRAWSSADDARIRALYPDTPTADLARALGRSLAATYNRARNLGVEKSAAYLASPSACRIRRGDKVGAASRFMPGHIPANKGLRGRKGWAPGRMRDGQFKPGDPTWRWQPIGSQREVGGYRYTKVSDHRGVPWTRNWRPTHVLLWEAAHGPIPPGHALVFTNRDRMDVRLENLELITRRDLMQRNTLHRYPKEIARAIQLIGALNRKINRRSRHEEQDRRPA